MKSYWCGLHAGGPPRGRVASFEKGSSFEIHDNDRWSHDDVRKLGRLVLANAPLVEIGGALGRTVSARELESSCRLLAWSDGAYPCTLVDVRGALESAEGPN